MTHDTAPPEIALTSSTFHHPLPARAALWP